MGEQFCTIINELKDKHQPKFTGLRNYSHALKHKLIYPQMINVAHLYSYYESYHELENAMDDNIEFFESRNGETVIDILLKRRSPNFTIVNKAVENILRKIEGINDHKLKSSE